MGDSASRQQVARGAGGDEGHHPAREDLEYPGVEIPRRPFAAVPREDDDEVDQ